jgi:hypothetical protein
VSNCTPIRFGEIFKCLRSSVINVAASCRLAGLVEQRGLMLALVGMFGVEIIGNGMFPKSNAGERIF